MTLTIECPQCRARLKAPPRLAGKPIQCPKCGTITRLPELPPAEAPAAEPRSAPVLVAVVRANRAMAGKPCPACGDEVLLGDEVVQCPQCALASHADCWEQRGGCWSPTCAGPRAAAPRPAAPAGRDLIPMHGPTKACPACAEQIPAKANVCPYCAEPLDAAARGGPAVPTTFDARSGFLLAKWHFQIRDDELIGRGPKPGQEVRVGRANAARDVTLRARTLTLRAGDRKHSFLVDDLGYVLVDYWLTGTVTPRTSALAKGAFVAAIVGIFVCYLQLVIGLGAVIQGIQANRLIGKHPQLLQGKGLATAAIVIGVVDMIIGLLVIVGHLAQA